MQYLFIYGTLKQGQCRAQYMTGTCVSTNAITRPQYRLYHLGSYPGLVEAAPLAGVAISGELWLVDQTTLQHLDKVEAVDEGLYQRRSILLANPFENIAVQTYIYLGVVTHCPDCGSEW